MPLKDVVHAQMGDKPIWKSGYEGFTIDASGEKFAMIIQVPKTGSITKVGFRTATVTTAQTLRVGIETMSSGNPSGTQYGGSAVGTQTSPASNTWYEVTLATPATAVKGDFVAIVIQFNATVGNLQICAGSAVFNNLLPYVSDFTGSWTKHGRIVIASLGYSDGTYPDFYAFPASSITEQNYASNSTPDERALRFKLPVPAKIKGVTMRFAASSGADFQLVLYDEDGTTALGTLGTVDDAVLQGSENAIVNFIFPSSVTLKKDKFYRLSLKPTTTTGVWLYEFTTNSAAVLDGHLGGQNFHLSTRTDGGAWTNATTTRPYIGLIFDSLHDGLVSDYIPT